MRSLPLLDGRRAELETCVYCPKLCRAVCPVSNAEPRETLTPWGKMSTAFFQARGDAPHDQEHSATAWACTGCYRCREHCDHRNEVAATLLDARAVWFERGVAPEAAKEVVRGFRDHLATVADTTAKLSTKEENHGAIPLLLGCGYTLHLEEEARDIISVARALVGPVKLVDQCCGLPLLMAGDTRGFAKQIELFQKYPTSVLVHDPGCALALRKAGIPVRLLIEEAAQQIGKFHRIETSVELRYHDPCQLGRGLGVYEEPRALLTRILGRPPQEFEEHRCDGACSGAGGLLPVTMPEVSKQITLARVGAHHHAGGGEIVTACASSLQSFRRVGASASDLSTWLARALRA